MDKLGKIQRELLAQSYALDAILAAIAKLDDCRVAAAKALDKSAEAAEVVAAEAATPDEGNDLQEALLGRISRFRAMLYDA